MENILNTANAIIWGVPVLLLMLFTGLFLSLRSGFAQIRLFPQAILHFIKSLRRSNRNSQGISGYKALCTALAATVGTGNIAGVAGAIAIGGPGVIFWMWICAIIGMITKLAEISLAIHFRVTDAGGQYVGGPMHMIERGLPAKYRQLAYLYSFLGVFAAFGVGNATQINAVLDGIKSIAHSVDYDFGMPEALLIGGTVAVFITLAFRNGAKGIGAWAERLVPFASVVYILLALGVLTINRSRIPGVLSEIISGAFSPRAATGGMVGSMFLTLRVGTSRGVFTNEAGMGTASIAHASAEVNHPVEQGMMGIIEVFLDTIILCTLSGLVILCSGVPIPYGTDPGISLTLDAFSSIYGNWSTILITLLVCIFAVATILGWGLYGARCVQYLFGERAWSFFILAQVVCIMLSVTLKTSVVWIFAEIINGLMAIPNLIAILYLLPVFSSLLKEYSENRKAYSHR